MAKNEKKEPQNPPHGGSWRQDPDTGELVQVVDQPEKTQAASNILGTELNSVPS